MRFRRKLDAREKVFRTTELMEGILKSLSPKTLYGIQRVNKQFQAVIAGSPSIQRRLYFRIDNKRVVRWHFREAINRPWLYDRWVFESESVKQTRKMDQITPVAINPSLDRLEASEKTTMLFTSSEKETIARGETLQLRHGLKFSLQQLDQPQPHGILNAFLSDPHCPAIEVHLCFVLGVRRPVFIKFTSTVKSFAPLTIGAIIAEVLNTESVVRIKRCKIDGHINPREELRTGIPRQVMNELKHKTSFEAYLRPSDSSFRLCRFLAPTPRQRAAVKGNRMKRIVGQPR